MTIPQENKAETPASQEKAESVTHLATDNNQSEIAKEVENTDPNWKAFREARKKDRALTEAAEKRAAEKEAEAAALKAAMEAAFARDDKPSRAAQAQYYSMNQEYGHPEESEDERIEKKVQAAIAQREAQRDKERAQREHQEYPNRLTQTYPDFNQTICEENLDYLDFHYPEVARPLKRLGDNFDKWEDIYKAIKKFVPNSVNSKKEAARADANFNKPKSMSSPTITQSGETQGSARISAEKRAENWKRMQKTLKGVS
jgi:hypothetical protein